MMPLFLVITENKAFAQLCRKALTNAGFQSSKLASTCLCNGRKSVTALSPDYVLLDGDCQNNMDDYIISLAPRYSVPIIYLTIQHNNKYPMMQAGAIDVVYKPDGTPSDNERFQKRFTESIQRLEKARANSVVHIPAINTSGIIAIGGSTGSTEALKAILKDLRHDLPPVVAVLHMPAGYTRIYAEQLCTETGHKVVEAKSGLYLSQGMVVIAQGGQHLRLFRDKKGYFVTSEAGVKVSGHCPSVDVLFDSVAYSAKRNAIGVILTGMGCDGAKGMLNMKKMGAYNIGQNAESSIVYGMPKAAYENGSVSKQCPLDKIAQEIHYRIDSGL